MFSKVFGKSPDKFTVEENARKLPISAGEAAKKTSAAIEAIKIKHRDQVFQFIHDTIKYGGNSTQVDAHLLRDGNDIFFEGLGYHIETEPVPEPNDITIQYGTTGVFNAYNPTYYHAPRVKISWDEKKEAQIYSEPQTKD